MTPFGRQLLLPQQGQLVGQLAQPLQIEGHGLGQLAILAAEALTENFRAQHQPGMGAAQVVGEAMQQLASGAGRVVDALQQPVDAQAEVADRGNALLRQQLQRGRRALLRQQGQQLAKGAFNLQPQEKHQPGQRADHDGQDAQRGQIPETVAEELGLEEPKGLAGSLVKSVQLHPVPAPRVLQGRLVALQPPLQPELPGHGLFHQPLKPPGLDRRAARQLVLLAHQHPRRQGLFSVLQHLLDQHRVLAQPQGRFADDARLKQQAHAQQQAQITGDAPQSQACDQQQPIRSCQACPGPRHGSAPWVSARL